MEEDSQLEEVPVDIEEIIEFFLLAEDVVLVDEGEAIRKFFSTEFCRRVACFLLFI